MQVQPAASVRVAARIRGSSSGAARVAVGHLAHHAERPHEGLIREYGIRRRYVVALRNRHVSRAARISLTVGDRRQQVRRLTCPVMKREIDGIAGATAAGHVVQTVAIYVHDVDTAADAEGGQADRCHACAGGFVQGIHSAAVGCDDQVGSPVTVPIDCHERKSG